MLRRVRSESQSAGRRVPSQMSATGLSRAAWNGTMQAEALAVTVAYLPPMSGLEANERRIDEGAIRVSLGQGKLSEKTLLRMEHGSGVGLIILALIHGGTIIWELHQKGWLKSSL